MMHRWYLLLSLFVLVLLTATTTSHAGILDPDLSARLDAMAAGERIAALVILETQAPVAELSLDLSRREASRAERHDVIVRALQEASSSQADLLIRLDELLAVGEVEGYTAYWIINGIVVRGTSDAIHEIASRADIARVGPNPEAELIEPVESRSMEGNLRGIGVTPGQRAIGADRVWYELGITGRGVLVANLDTGVDGYHPALVDRWRGNNGHPWQECWLDVLGDGDTTYPTDDGGHGTHVMGTITGLGAATEDTIGTAWGAEWIACNAINQGVGDEIDNDILNAFQWFADPDGNPATIDDVPDVVQNSWGIHEGFGHGYTDCDDRWWAVIDNCEAAGCVVTFSAGNEGPNPMTLRSPADRTTTPLNTFAIGAVDATNYDWPYPIAGFSSRGPSGCEGNETKPEIAAPGVDVYSSVPGGGYEQNGWSGTSMAGPHVAGIAGLMREANPDLEVDLIKQILLDTSRDEGDPGEDNDYGWGFPDAYAAVSIALTGTGVLEGSVTNATDGGVPVEDAQILLTGSAASFPTDAQGDYRGRAIAGTYTAYVKHWSFSSDSAEVTITVDSVTIQDFSVEDVVGPDVTDVSDPRTIPGEAGPYPIEATITDQSAIVLASIRYRVDGGDWLDAGMTGDGDLYSGGIPGQPAGSTIDFYISAEDIGGNTGTFPADAPGSYRTFYVTLPVLVDDAETNQGWSMGWFGDTATAGFWVREDPVGTMVGARPGQPEDDHTPDPGHICFITGNGEPGAPAGSADVDGGCTSLVSPALDLSDADEAFVYYWRWFGQFGLAGDTFSVQVSSNNGITWSDLELLGSLANSWTEVALQLTDYIELTDTMRLRFFVCDIGFDSVIEGAVDDVSIEALPSNPAGVAEGAGRDLRAFLAPPRPNPAREATRIVFRLATSGEVHLDLYDTAGRHVRRLIDGELRAGTHEVIWDGRDRENREVGAGVYFYHLEAGAYQQSSRLVRVD